MRKYIKFTVLSLLAVLVIVWFGRNLDWSKIADALQRSDWKLISLAVALICVTYLVRAVRWRALLAPLAPEASLRELFAATTVGFGAVFLVGRAGEVLRPAFLPLRDRRVRPGAAFVTIGVERIYDMAAIVVLFAANLLVLDAPGADALLLRRVRWAGFVLLLAAAVGIAGLVWFRWYSGSVINLLNRICARLPSVLKRVGGVVVGILDQLARALSVLTNARELVITIGWTALLWGIIALANVLVLHAFGLKVSLSEAVFVMGWSLVGSLVPTPGGAAGTFHAATAAGLVVLGLTRMAEEAAAVSIVLHLVLFGPALFFGLYYFLRSDVSLARLRRLASSEEVAQDDQDSDDNLQIAPLAGESRQARDTPREAIT